MAVLSWILGLWRGSWCHLAGEESRLLYFNCVVAVCVLCFFLAQLWVGMQSVVVAFPYRTCFLISLMFCLTDGHSYKMAVWLFVKTTKNLHFVPNPPIQKLDENISFFLQKRSWYQLV